MKNPTPRRPNVRSAHLSEDLSRQIDAWIASQPEPRPSRSAAIRRILSQALSKPADAVKSPPPPLPPPSDAFLRALGHQSENAEGANGGRPRRIHDVRAPPRPCRQHPPTRLSRTCLQQAH